MPCFNEYCSEVSELDDFRQQTGWLVCVSGPESINYVRSKYENSNSPVTKLIIGPGFHLPTVSQDRATRRSPLLLHTVYISSVFKAFNDWIDKYIHLVFRKLNTDRRCLSKQQNQVLLPH